MSVTDATSTAEWAAHRLADLLDELLAAGVVVHTCGCCDELRVSHADDPPRSYVTIWPPTLIDGTFVDTSEVRP